MTGVRNPIAWENLTPPGRWLKHLLLSLVSTYSFVYFWAFLSEATTCSQLSTTPHPPVLPVISGFCAVQLRPDWAASNNIASDSSPWHIRERIRTAFADATACVTPHHLQCFTTDTTLLGAGTLLQCPDETKACSKIYNIARILVCFVIVDIVTWVVSLGMMCPSDGHHECLLDPECQFLCFFRTPFMLLTFISPLIRRAVREAVSRNTNEPSVISLVIELCDGVHSILSLYVAYLSWSFSDGWSYYLIAWKICLLLQALNAISNVISWCGRVSLRNATTLFTDEL